MKRCFPLVLVMLMVAVASFSGSYFWQEGEMVQGTKINYALNEKADLAGAAFTGPITMTASSNGYISNTFQNTSNGVSAVNRIQIGNDASASSGQIVVYGSQHTLLANVLDITQTNNYPMRLLTNNTERVRVTGAGLVGIATSTPNATLHVDGYFQASMPTVIAWNNASSPVELAAQVVATYATEVIDSHNCWDGTSFVAPVKGIYIVGAGNFLYSNGTASDHGTYQILTTVNGSFNAKCPMYVSAAVASNSETLVLQSSVVAALDAGDVVRFVVYYNTSRQTSRIASELNNMHVRCIQKGW